MRARCKVCLYAWRDTEPEENRNPDLYPELFRLKPEDVRNFPIVPTILALRKKKSDE
jgi:vanillate/4-hydroxybenzoate decarboxylase subunit D